MIEKHSHRGGPDGDRINASYLTGPAVIFADTATGVSALRQVQQSVIERGFYTLGVSAVAFITFPQVYSETTTLAVLLTPWSNATHWVNGIATSGFTVSGAAASQTGNWMSIGYK